MRQMAGPGAAWVRRARTLGGWLSGRLACLAVGVLVGGVGAALPSGLPGLSLADWRQLARELPAAASAAWSAALQPLQDLGLALRQDGGAVVAGTGASVAARAPDAAEVARRMRPGRDFSACASQFPGAVALQTQDMSPQWRARALCFDGFAVLYSGLARTPLVVVERLEAASLREALAQSRTDEFFADERLAPGQRAELADYAGSGYDRGHMAAAANRASTASMVQSFTLSNMVPQNPENNRKVWADLESAVRKFARRADGPVYVFTGPLFDGERRTIGANRVWVPGHLFKLVYDESSQRAWGYVLPNTAEARLSAPMDYAQFVQRTGWHLLAAVPVRGAAAR